jgi:hypothetical protein
MPVMRLVTAGSQNMTDNVTPFRPRRKAATLPPAEAALTRRVQRAQPGARALAAEQSAKQKDRYAAAAIRQQNERLIATGRIVPARITLALDMCGLEGPAVDIACGGTEPDVDMWELGLAVPTPEQLEKLASLTGFTVAHFYMPIDPGPLTGPVFICGSGDCESRPPDVVDEHGVLLYGGQPRQLPLAAQGTLF